MNHLRTLAACGALVLLASCERQQFRTRLVKEWPADQVSEVKLRGINGKVKVESDSSGKVSLVADIRASGQPARKAIERGLIDTRLRGRELDIREKVVSKKVIEMVPFFKTGHVKITYLLKVPEATDISVSTINGVIESEGVSGSLELETINGSIRVDTPRGQLDAKTVNGSIRADFSQEFRGAQLRTVNGSIKLSVPPGASIDAQVDQVNGAFRTNMPVTVSASPGHRASSGSINGGEFPLDISTMNGTVTLEQRESSDRPTATQTTAALQLER